jgi:DNA-binding NarL/FixJ family response regulator
VGALNKSGRLGRPKAELKLTPPERRVLSSWSRMTGDTPAPVAWRSRIILMAATGATNIDVARRLRTSPQTVGKWRRRFLESRADGLWAPRDRLRISRKR